MATAKFLSFSRKEWWITPNDFLTIIDDKRQQKEMEKNQNKSNILLNAVNYGMRTHVHFYIDHKSRDNEKNAQNHNVS